MSSILIAILLSASLSSAIASPGSNLRFSKLADQVSFRSTHPEVSSCLFGEKPAASTYSKLADQAKAGQAATTDAIASERMSSALPTSAYSKLLDQNQVKEGVGRSAMLPSSNCAPMM